MAHPLYLLFALLLGTGADMVERAPDPVAQLTRVTENLSSQVTSLTAKATALQNDLDDKQSEINSLKSQVQRDHELINNLTHRVNQQDRESDNINDYCRDHVSDLTSRISVVETPVAFTVRFNDDDVGNHSAHSRPGSTLLFDRVQYQTGGSNYNTSTGEFTAPVKGAYAFFVTTQRNNPTQDQCLQVTLIRNRNSYFGCTASTCPPGYTSASITCIQPLNRGDRVHAIADHDQAIFGHIHTSFSGFLLGPL